MASCWHRAAFSRARVARDISAARTVGGGTVSEYVGWARRAELSCPLPEELDDAALEAKIFPAPAGGDSPRPRPDVAWIHQELKHSGVTLQHPQEEDLPDAAMPGRIDVEPAHSRAAGGVGVWRITVADRHLVWIAVLFAIVVLAIHSVVIHPWMLDDAFISFKYAHNLSGGDGPVYNPGERVEGYTCFLWVALLALGESVGLAPVFFSKLLGLIFAVACILLLANAHRFVASGTAVGFAPRRNPPLGQPAWPPAFPGSHLCPDGSCPSGRGPGRGFDHPL
jgi:hypothetical protein